jgi:hypothetical protein
MWDVPETQSTVFVRRIRRIWSRPSGLCVNLAKRLKMDAEKSDSVSEKVKAKAEKRRNDDAEPKERRLLEKEARMSVCEFGEAQRGRKEAWLPGRRPKRQIESKRERRSEG